MSPSGGTPRGALGELVIRRSAPGDARALRRLAQLDSAAPPAGDHLLAEEDGRLRAALPLDGGPVIADPFHHTVELVAMLELRAARLAGAGGGAEARRGVLARVRAPRPRTAAIAPGALAADSGLGPLPPID